ncbi:Trans-1,2-dihydrobenzene-1,2-diol dehydrogenase [Lonchura striata]|uniref:Trans-1,2-dihydrobenzene-1,2-diol dehydrogenase n=1 Tax=Lonchura striata TaxID=40157 RepID=A0A218U930_9PASE|nr:Trans-1,2-dihydrobenzene-1,2-diol dehydrogenase [Lonchura striata domestica]
MSALELPNIQEREAEPCPEPEPPGARPGPPPTRWGICAAGAISHDFVLALGTLPRSEHTVAAVAARDLGRAQAFARRFGVPRAYGSYEELAEDPDIDVVYVGTVNPAHLPAGLLFLRRGRAVLMEKPMALGAREVAQLVGTARERGVFLMEVPLPSAPSFHMNCPTELLWGGHRERFPLPALAEPPNFPHGAGLRYEAQHVRDCLLRGLTESPEMPLAESEVIAQLLDEARAQVGVRLSGATTDHPERPLTLSSDQPPSGVTTDHPERPLTLLSDQPPSGVTTDCLE